MWIARFPHQKMGARRTNFEGVHRQQANGKNQQAIKSGDSATTPKESLAKSL
jgi:hypothetical protein